MMASMGFVCGWNIRGNAFLPSRCRSCSGRPLSVTAHPVSDGMRRNVVMMGKKKRVVNEDDAVDVFGGANAGEDLFATAMAEEPKKGKKKKKKGVVEAEDNIVDVFAGENAGEDLLAAAMAEEPKKGKKKKKKGVVEAEDNVVDVFGGANADEDLLAAAMAEEPKKGKKKKKGVVEAEDNVVDVFGGVNAGEDLLAAAMAEEPKKGKKKKKKGAVEAEDNVVDVFGGANAGEDLMATAMAEEPKKGKKKKKGVVEAEDNGVVEAEVVLPVVEDEDIDYDDVPEEELDDDLVAELEVLANEVEDFTMRGVKKRAQNVRKGSLDRTGGDKYLFVRLEEVGHTFKNADVLKSVTWEVKTGDKIGLVGQNGSGKTTQLKMIAGLLEPNTGTVLKSSDRIKASFLRQEFVDELDLEATLLSEFQTAFVEETKALKRYKEVEDDMTASSSDMQKMESLLNEMEDLRQKLDSMDAWNLDSRIDKLLPLLGFTEEDLSAKVGSFSGGWKVRIGLGKILLQNPDLLLLDEPTNHLDLDSVEWLENFLDSSDLPMVIVSHDREFMDRLCTKIVEVESGEAFEYKGNYTSFVKQKAMRRQQWDAAYERQQKFVDEQMQFIRRFRSSAARAAQVKSRQKMLDRLKLSGDWVRQPPRGGKPLVFRFPPAPRSGRDVCIVENVTHGYDGHLLFKDANFVLERGDRIAIIGPNGAGKSTMLRIALGIEAPKSGEVQCSELHGVVPAYFAQNQADALDLTKTVLETVQEAQSGDMRYEEIRAVLGKFLFKGDTVNKRVGDLSGGEKARVALCKMMVSPANFLVLDEPTNHLDIPAKEMLEEALQHFDGTLLVVSHDRYFVSQVAKQILAIEDGEVILHDGDYKSYVERNTALLEKMQERQIDGLTNIRSAPEVNWEEIAPVATKKRKNFGGSGVKSGKTKEMNAKRWA